MPKLASDVVTAQNRNEATMILSFIDDALGAYDGSNYEGVQAHAAMDGTYYAGLTFGVASQFAERDKRTF